MTSMRTHGLIAILVLLAAIVLRERPTPKQMFGTCVAFAGLAVIGFATSSAGIPLVSVALILASALTWYYTVSNAITLMLQFVIQNYIIDHDKILAKLQENRSKPKTKTKWQERLEQMQEAQKKAQPPAKKK